MRAGKENRDDAALARAAQGGDKDAFTALVERYRNIVYGISYDQLRHFEQARDAAQETFIRAYLRLRDLRTPEKFAPWLYQMTVNECRMRRRAESRVSVGLSDDAAEAGTAWATVSVEKSVAENVEERIIIQQALERLTPDSRRALLLFYFQGHSLKEIAAFLDSPVSAVKSRLRDARLRLRREMLEMIEETVKAEPLPSGFSRDIEDVLQAVTFARFGKVALSPQGDGVAFTSLSERSLPPMGGGRTMYFNETGVSAESYGADIGVADRESGVTRSVTGGVGSSWSPEWSPDGGRLAFYSDRDGRARLWVWDKTTDAPFPVGSRTARPYFDFERPCWTSDGCSLLYKALPEGMSIAEANALSDELPDIPPPANTSQRPAITVYSSDAFGSENPPDRTAAKEVEARFRFRYFSDLVLTDVKSGAERTLASGVTPVWFRLSPDDQYAAYSEITGVSPANAEQIYGDLKIISLSDGVPRTLATNVPLHFCCTLSWSPDSARLAYTTSGTEATGFCHLVAVSDGQASLATTEPLPFFGDPFRPPIWDDNGESLYGFNFGPTLWRLPLTGPEQGKALPVAETPGERIIAVLTHAGGTRLATIEGGAATLMVTRSDRDKTISLYHVNLTTGQIERRRNAAQQWGIDRIRQLERAEKTDVIAFIAEDSQNSPDVHVMEAPFAAPPQRLTRMNPALQGVAFGASRLVEWQNSKGDTVQGALLLPADYEPGKRCPLIVRVYPRNTHSDNVFLFGSDAPYGTANMQVLATRGCAVFLPDVNVNDANFFRDILDVVMSGVDSLIESGIADPERLGVFGHSGGGYSVLSLLVQTNRFKAAVASASYGNLINSATYLGDGAAGAFWMDYTVNRMEATFWQQRDRYLNNSPVFFLDRVETPLLLLHGGRDNTTPIHFAEETYNCLRYLGKTVTLVRYEGEDHSPNAWGYANQKDYWRRVLDWFARHLNSA